MKILFIVPYVPNLVHVRSYNLIKSLVRRGHQLTLATLWTDASDLADLELLKPFCQQILAFPLPKWRSYLNSVLALTTQDPIQSAFCWNPKMADSLKSLFEVHSNPGNFDLIHIEHLRGIRYGLFLGNDRALKGRRQAGSKYPPIVWDSVDNISLLFRQSSSQSRRLSSRLIDRFELPKTERYEAWLSQKFSHILVTSINDRKAFLEMRPERTTHSDISVIPNGVDLDFFVPDPTIVRQPDMLVISGKMSYHANVTMCLNFVSQVMPLIWNKKPGVKLWIVGKDPTPALWTLEKNPAVKVTGTVPDMRPYLQKAALAVAPLTYGVGIQNKVLEAMACATPVVASPQAVSALEAVPGQDIAVSRSPEDFAQTILHLMDEPTERERLGLNGRKYVEANHRWADIAAHLEEVYHGVLPD
jgi:glycosyltransferase involved in cell wall biosynthesis